MKTDKAVFISTLVWLALLIGLLAACKGEGPMGPPGEQGPEGTGGSGSGGGGGALVYVTPDDATIEWEFIDGGSSRYNVGALNVNGYSWKGDQEDNGLPLAEEAVSAIDQGGLMLVYADFGGGWRSLPIMDITLENNQFAIYLNYELVDGKLIIWYRVHEDRTTLFDEQYIVKRLKVVVAPATEQGELTTNER